MSHVLPAHKVLMLVENRPAPADARVWPEACALRDHGFQVSIISPKGTGEHRETHSYIDGIHIYRYALPSGNTAFAYLAEYTIALAMTFWLSVKVYRHQGFDVIHTANPPDIFFVIGWFYQLLGKKFVFDQHDLAPELFDVRFGAGQSPSRVTQLLYRCMQFCERCSYRTADLVIVTNQSFQRVATGRGGCLAAKVTVVRNGPDARCMQPAKLESELKMGRRYLLAYVGVMGVQDGVEYALRALHELVYVRGRHDVALVLMGDGADVPVLRALAHHLGLDAYVKFTGWVGRDDIIRYLTVADIGLSPDPQNPLNDACTMIKTMEYMAMGKPVVAFDLTETRYSAGEAGLYATPNLVEDFADKIEILLDDYELRLRMGLLGRKRVEEELNWEHSKEHLLVAYGTLLSGAQSRHVRVASSQAHQHDRSVA